MFASENKWFVLSLLFLLIALIIFHRINNLFTTTCPVDYKPFGSDVYQFLFRFCRVRYDYVACNDITTFFWDFWPGATCVIELNYKFLVLAGASVTCTVSCFFLFLEREAEKHLVDLCSFLKSFFGKNDPANAQPKD